MTTVPPAVPTASFQLDPHSGDLFIRNAAGLIVAQLNVLEQAQLLHAILGAHLHAFAAAQTSPVTSPILSPVR